MALPILEAHRGYSFAYPENTLLAFRQAIATGARAIELDIHCSRDGEFVVMHDPTVDRTSNGHGRIADLTWAELRQLDAGAWKNPAFAGEKIPALHEVLQLSHHVPVTFNVEIKTFSDPAAATRLAALLQSHAPQGGSHVASSFNLEALLQVRAADPTLPLALIGRAEAIVPAAISHGIPWVHCHFSSANADMVAMAHAHGLKVNIWTLDQPHLLQHYIRNGIDKFCTNRCLEMRPALR